MQKISRQPWLNAMAKTRQKRDENSLLSRAFFRLLSIAYLLLNMNALHAAAQNGVLDLGSSSWTDSISLEGEWIFYPNIFVNEADLASDRLRPDLGIRTHIPGNLSQSVAGSVESTNDHAWGSLVLEIQNLKPPMENLGLHLRGDTAFRVFVQDLDRRSPLRLLLQVGVPAAKQSDSTPQIASPLGIWNMEGSGHYLLIVHLSGFHYTDTNLWVSPQIGPYELLKRELDRVFLLDSLVAGGMFIMSIYYFSLFFHRREDKASLLLATLSSAVFFRHISCSASIQQVIFPHPSLLVFSIIRIWEFGLLGIMGGAGAWFAAESFHIERLCRVAKIQLAIGVGLLLFCIVTPPTIYPKFILLFNLVLFIQVLTYLAATLWAMKQRAKGSLYLTLGGLTTGATVVYDMSIGLGYHASPFFVTPIGMTFLIFANGQIVAKLFAKAFRTAQHLSLALQNEVQRKTRSLQSMLDNIPQGVVTFVADGLAEPEYSKHLESLLGTSDIARQSIESLLLNFSYLTSDEKDRIMATFRACMGEHVLNFELNANQLPSEMHFDRDGQHKYFQVSWTPLCNRQEIVESIQVTLNDLTRLRLMEQESQDQKQELGYIQEILSINPEYFRVFVDSSTHLLSENKRLIECNSSGLENVVKILFINMHTIKGSARTLGFKRISNQLHEVEQGYVQSLKNSCQDWNQSSLLSQIEMLEVTLNHYQHIFHNVLGHQKSKESEIGLSREFLEQHCQMLSKLSLSINQPHLRAKLIGSLRILEEEVFQDAGDFFQDLLPAAQRIARDLGKDPPLVLVDAEDFILSHDATIALGKAVIHILRNALDHGIEFAQERMEKAKAPFGCIKFHLEERDNRLCIKVEDDGRGLAMGALKSKATQHGLDASASTQTIAELVFKAGLSTAKNITDVSGRGMGMDAMRKFIRDVGGDVQILLGASEGPAEFMPFQILIFLPSQFYRRKDIDPSEGTIVDLFGKDA